MFKQVLAGAAFATAATMAVAAPASANTPVPQGHKTAADAIQSVLSAAAGPTTSGTGTGCNCGTATGTTGNPTGTVTNLTGTTGNLTTNPTGAVTSAAGNPTGTLSSAVGNPTGAVSNLTGTTGNLTGATGGLTGTSVPGTGASGDGATDFSTRNGDTVITGSDGEGAGGILNTYGASLANVDLRCAVPLPEGEGIGGHGLTGPKAACNIAPVDQYEAPQKLL
ncbi:hypothetical protein [Streptomyces sp. NBC_00212]|uniref:hypothetical protein n=1 Tax=Streptomyces sp. NBC_00212 TaxID=2975684 RepID=UPI002F90E89B